MVVTLENCFMAGKTQEFQAGDISVANGQETTMANHSRAIVTQMVGSTIQAYVAKLVQASFSEPPSNNGAKNPRCCFLPCPDAYELALGDVKSAGL